MSELEIWNELGNIYFNDGAYDQAIRIYQKAIELDQGCVQSYANLASIFVRQERLRDAIPLLKKGIGISNEATDKAGLWNQLGEIYLKLKEYGNAMASYQKAAELDPGNTAFQDNLAEAELGYRSTHPSSTPAADEVIALDPEPLPLAREDDVTIPELLSGLLDTLTSSEPEAASWVFKNNNLVFLDEEQVTEPPEPAPVILGSRILSAESGQEDPDEAPDLSEKPSQESDLRMKGLLRLGLLHWHNGEYERSLQFLKIAVDVVPRPKDNFLEALSYYGIALVETDLGKTADAIQAYQSAAILAPEQIFPWNSVGNLNCMLDRYEDALAAFREAIEHNPKDTVSWNSLGDVYHKLGRSEDAIAAYQLGNVFEKTDQSNEDVLKAYEMAMEASRENPLIWNEAGNIYAEIGSYEDAIASYRRAIEIDPANSYGFQANLTKAEQAWYATMENEPSGPQTGSEIDPADHPKAEPRVAEKAPTIPVEYTVVQTDTTVIEKAPEEKTVPKVLSNMYDGLEHPEPQPAYWVIKTDNTLENALQPAAKYTPAFAETAQSTCSHVPPFTMQRSDEQAYSDRQVLTDPGKAIDPLLVQLPPRATGPARMEENGRASTAANDWRSAYPEVAPDLPKSTAVATETKTAAPARPAIQSGDLARNQSAIDRHILEKDITAYRRVTEENPKNDRAWDALGNMYEAMGLHSEAIAAFEQAIALGPEKEAYHYHLGIALAYQMHYGKAIQALEKVIELNPNYVLAHCALGAYYRRVGNEAKAQKHTAIARPSMENESEYNRAYFESISGNADQALALLEVALKKEQVQPAMLRSDPDLDFIRTDPRFEMLLQKNQYVSQ